MTLQSYKTFVLLLLCVGGKSWGYRILGFFPNPINSHHSTFRPIVLELAKRGHHVVYVTPVHPNVNHTNMDVRLMKPFKHEYFDILGVRSLGKALAPSISEAFSKATVALADHFYGDPEVQAIIHGSESFDAVLMESYLAQEPSSALLHKFGCVAIEVAAFGNSAWLNELSGLPDNPAYQVDFKGTYSDSMSLLERLHNLYITWSTVLLSYYHLSNMQYVMDRYFNYSGWEGRPPINNLISNRSMVLVNRDVVIDYPYPQAPHVKDIGGVNIESSKPLPKEIKKFLDNEPNGVIYFSLGSIMNTSDIVSGAFGRAVMSVFRDSHMKVLMKWEHDAQDMMPPNVFTSKWLPQQDILAHKNCILFISHGGLNSIAEAVYHAVPIVGIPFFADHHKNMKQVVTAGYGLQLSNDNITHKSLQWAINEVISNKKYREEVLRRSNMIQERWRGGAEEAAYWTEYGIKYPFLLTPKAAYLSFIQIHNIDLKAIIILSIFFLYKSFSLLFKRFSRKKKKVKVP